MMGTSLLSIPWAITQVRTLNCCSRCFTLLILLVTTWKWAPSLPPPPPPGKYVPCFSPLVFQCDGCCGVGWFLGHHGYHHSGSVLHAVALPSPVVQLNFCFLQAGFTLGMILMVIMSFICLYTCYLIVKSAEGPSKCIELIRSTVSLLNLYWQIPWNHWYGSKIHTLYCVENRACQWMKIL